MFLRSFNRTIIELKHPQRDWLKRSKYSFNRTIIELKLRGYLRPHEFGRSFNRTIIELKPPRGLYMCSRMQAFNRTIIELKLNNSRSVHHHIFLLIGLS